MHHIILFDGECAFCHRSVRKVMALDKKKIFQFEPLGSEIAQELLPEKYRKEDTLVLLEKNGRIWMRGRAVFRILWLIGGPWKLIAWLCFLPFGPDALYRLIARHRHRFS